MRRSTRVMEPAGCLAEPPAPVRPSGPALGLYVHVPFCETKCSYCSFHSIPSAGDLHEAFTTALCREIREAAQRGREIVGEATLEGMWRPGAPPAVDTIFFGGGTPSLLSPDQLGRILAACRNEFAVGGSFCSRSHGGSRAEARSYPEITVECNPGTVDRDRLATLRGHGFNRLSFGAQSFDDVELKSLGRIHSARDIAEGVAAARAAGFDNVSLDLIFALPGQTLDRWMANLRAAIDLGPEHLSCYMLQFDPGTPMTAAMLRGAVRPVDDDLQREMLLATIDTLAAAGFESYEISNYARPGFACRHNLKYWTGAPYLGFGPSAHSFIPSSSCPVRTTDAPAASPERGGDASGGIRWANLVGIEEYIRRVARGEPLAAMREALTREQRMFETVFLGLRRTGGVDLDAFARRFGVPFDAPYGAASRRFIAEGLLETTGGFLRLTRCGLPVADLIMAEFA